MIYCESAVKKYGWIGVTYENTDIKTKEQLISKGIVYLKELISPKRTIEIKAVDMHLINPELKPIRIGEYIRVRSIPHNLDSYFLCSGINLDLNNPENSTYTLGTTFDTLTGQQNKRIKLLNASINQTYEKAEQLTEQERQNAISASEAIKKSNEAHSTATKAMGTATLAKAVADAAVTTVTDEYAVSDSSSDPPKDGWTTETPEWTEGHYIWRRTTTTYGDGITETGAPALMTGNSGEKGEDAVTLRIESSRGTVFKNNSISTVLSVVIYKGGSRITDSATMKSIFGSTAYLQWKWQRLDDKSFGIISAGDPRFGDNGFTFSLSPDDVDTKVIFMCELIM